MVGRREIRGEVVQGDGAHVVMTFEDLGSLEIITDLWELQRNGETACACRVGF